MKWMFLNYIRWSAGGDGDGGAFWCCDWPLFHRDDWQGGYNSFRRRLMRLGHIAFFGLGILNLLFAFTTKTIQLSPLYIEIASAGFIVAVIAMPLCCFLAAWRKPFRHLFPIPVIAVLAGIVPTVMGGL
ncbi:hypothetical protein [Candidatus Reidiella endopervernicosa]|uniref:Uncharacterized protein n=1 Tax=Candidatus Reidiella endopervernicosa TaxID=2738883 RepID=A0A6N0HYR1_9GAMM|nr:hypothetical protein [Candidatus Reidiella endopervernicosa]QKQ27495.1 hypothetical protein HUE57_15295 [Candidatus Reidiella endopervernicosa]